MYRFKKILVGINLHEQDEATVHFAGLISKMTQCAEIHFVHIAQKSNLPKSFIKEYPDLLPPIDEILVDRVTEQIEPYFDGANETKVFPVVAHGETTIELLRKAREVDADLILIGRKTDSQGQNNLQQRITRKSSCSVLIVPQHSPASITKILTTVDFSEHSKRALDKSVLYAKVVGLKELFTLHCYELPIGYGKTGISEEEFCTRLEKHLETDYLEFVEQVDNMGIKIHRKLQQGSDLSETVRKEVEILRADLLVVGSRGLSTAAVILLGSLTEDLIWTAQVPLLVIKEKNSEVGLLDAILKGA